MFPVFHALKRNVPNVEDHVLERLCPRDLVRAKRVNRVWATAVRSYIRRLDHERRGDLMTEAFLEPVTVCAIAKLPQIVRDLTITRSGEVYILGDDSIMQLDTDDFHVKKNLEFDNMLWCSENEMHLSAKKGGEKFELRCKGCLPIKYSTDGTGKLIFLGRRLRGMIRNPKATATRIPSMMVRWSRKHLQNLRRGLGATDVVKLANGFLLFSVDDVDGDGEEHSSIFAYMSFKMAPRLIAMVPMKNAKLRVIGTRVFCYSSDRDSDCVVVFDVWNPDSVDVESDNVGVTERMLDVRRCCGLGSVPTPCVICSSSKGRLYICDECLYDEELGLQQ